MRSERQYSTDHATPCHARGCYECSYNLIQLFLKVVGQMALSLARLRCRSHPAVGRGRPRRRRRCRCRPKLGFHLRVFVGWKEQKNERLYY